MPFPGPPTTQTSEADFRHAGKLRHHRSAREDPRKAELDLRQLRQEVQLSHRQLLQDRPLGGATHVKIHVGTTKAVPMEGREPLHRNLNINDSLISL